MKKAKIIFLIATVTIITLIFYKQQKQKSVKVQANPVKVQANPVEKIDVLSWSRMSADEFGCLMEKTFGYRDTFFNCSLENYVNNSDPCANHIEYYNGPKFPDSLAKKIHPLLKSININWEHGNIQSMFFGFDSKLTKEQIFSAMGISSQKKERENILNIQCNEAGLYVVCFEHIGAGEIDCND